ncbi:hypothetical protein E4T44_06627 [Aureobasidium sp. EXF-8845]|nr:hypothetical protein E4T44_06627 [Aureobasidium sp. EXF-8845]KAI4847852.1 hypothetical protein E4T45_06592 [Aureobasidium sp. EXF-8846]
MSFLSGFYTRLSGTFSRPNEDGLVTVANVAHSDSANSNDASSRTLSPEDDNGDVDTPGKAPVSVVRSRIPPTPTLAPPATPFAGHASPVVNRAAAEQLMREAGASAPTPALRPTPFFGIFAPPQTPAARDLSPVRNQAAEEQLMREMLDEVPETPAPVHVKAASTPMTLYKTPAASHTTPIEPSTEQSLATDAFQTPSIMPTRLQLQGQSPIQEESEIVFDNIEQESLSSSTAAIEQDDDDREDSEVSEVSAASSPHQVVDLDLSDAEDHDTSTTSIESSDSEKRRTMVMTTNKGRKNQRRTNQRITSKNFEDRRTRVQKASRPGMGRSVSGREELLNRARKRFYDAKATGNNNKLF